MMKGIASIKLVMSKGIALLIRAWLFLQVKTGSFFMVISFNNSSVVANAQR